MTPKMVAIGVVLALVSLAVSVRAETITRCGASSGQGWYFAGPFVPQGEAGWTDDAISKGGFLLIVDGAEPDIITTDVAGTRSSRADGAHVMFVPGTKSGFRMVLVVYSGAVEHFLFQLDRAGNGTVAWGTVRGAGLLQKSSLFVAKCHAP
jgi:hypothetical protein